MHSFHSIVYCFVPLFVVIKGDNDKMPPLAALADCSRGVDVRSEPPPSMWSSRQPPILPMPRAGPDPNYKFCQNLPTFSCLQ